MAAAVRVRRDYEAAQIRVLAKRSKDAAQTRRLLALAAIYDGGSRTEAARIGGVGLQTVRDWVLDEFRISISKQTLSRELRAVGFRKLSARPRHHAQDAATLAAFKKTSPPASTRSPSATRQASR